MLSSCSEPSSSANQSRVAGASGRAERSMSAAMKLAICARLTGSAGVKPAAVRPRAIPHQTAQSTLDSCGLLAATSEKPSSGTRPEGQESSVSRARGAGAGDGSGSVLGDGEGVGSPPGVDDGDGD